MKVDYHEVARQYSLLSHHYEDWSRIDWHENVRLQGRALHGVLTEAGVCTGGDAARCRVLDFTCGMGTQVTGLALHGYDVTGMDLSAGQIERATIEAQRFEIGRPINWVVGDALHADQYVCGPFDVVVSFGNSLPLLGSLENITAVVEKMYSLLRPGGLLLLSLLDYTAARQNRPAVMQYGAVDKGERQGIWMETAQWTDAGAQYRSDVYFSYIKPALKVVHYPFPLLYAIMKDEMLEILGAAGLADITYKTREQVPHFSCPFFMARKPGDVRQMRLLYGSGA